MIPDLTDNSTSEEKLAWFYLTRLEKHNFATGAEDAGYTAGFHQGLDKKDLVVTPPVPDAVRRAHVMGYIDASDLVTAGEVADETFYLKSVEEQLRNIVKGLKPH